jgi:hypothetical protein
VYVCKTAKRWVPDVKKSSDCNENYLLDGTRENRTYAIRVWGGRGRRGGWDPWTSGALDPWTSMRCSLVVPIAANIAPASSIASDLRFMG